MPGSTRLDGRRGADDVQLECGGQVGRCGVGDRLDQRDVGQRAEAQDLRRRRARRSPVRAQPGSRMSAVGAADVEALAGELATRPSRRARLRALDGLAGALGGDGLDVRSATADIREPDGLARAIGELGEAEVLCFSPLPDVSLIKPVADTTAAELAAALELNVVGAAAAVQAVLPGIARAGAGRCCSPPAARVAPSQRARMSGGGYGAEVVYARNLPPRRWRRRGSTSRWRRSSARSGLGRRTSQRRWPRSCGSATSAAARHRCILR